MTGTDEMRNQDAAQPLAGFTAWPAFKVVQRVVIYAVARQWGWLSADEICKLGDLGRDSGGETYLQALNMASAAGGAEAGSNG